MTELSYRIKGLKSTMIIDMSSEKFEEFYLKLRTLCEEHDVHMSCTIHRADVLTYEDGED